MQVGNQPLGRLLLLSFLLVHRSGFADFCSGSFLGAFFGIFCPGFLMQNLAVQLEGIVKT